MKVPYIKVSDPIRFVFHGDSHPLPSGVHKVADVFARFGPPQPGQPLSGWSEVAASVAKQHPDKVALFIDYVPDPVVVDPKDARIAELEAKVAELEAATAAHAAQEAAVPQPDGDPGGDHDGDEAA